MQKTEYIERLRWFADHQGRGLPDEYGHPDYRAARGEALLARMFADWLVDNAPEEQDGLCWERDIPRLLIDAHADFADVSITRWADARAEYLSEACRPIPNLVDVYAGGVERQLVAYAARLHPLLAKAPWLRERIVTATEAQMAVITHAWAAFVRKAYRPLIQRIRAERHRGNAGTFGETTLLTYSTAGRAIFTFRRPVGNITFVADESDDYGYRAGPNYPGAPYTACVAMITDVVSHWDDALLVRSDSAGLRAEVTLVCEHEAQDANLDRCSACPPDHEDRYRKRYVWTEVLEPPCGNATSCANVRCIHRNRWQNASFIRLPTTRAQWEEATGSAPTGRGVDRRQLADLLEDCGFEIRPGVRP